MQPHADDHTTLFCYEMVHSPHVHIISISKHISRSHKHAQGWASILGTYNEAFNAHQQHSTFVHRTGLQGREFESQSIYIYIHSIDQPGLPTFAISCTHRQAYNCTSTGQAQTASINTTYKTKNKKTSRDITDRLSMSVGVALQLQREGPNTRTRTWLGLPITKHCTRIQARAHRYIARAVQAKHCTRGTSTSANTGK